MLAGVCAALHVGKLAPAIGALQQALALTLVQAGFALGIVQAAGMCLGLAFGAGADGLGARRSMLIGLLVLGTASALGGSATGAAMLMALRGVEGLGFLLVALPAPGLVRRLVPAARVDRVLGVWGAYMPVATALALLLGPLVIGALTWRGWWWTLATVTFAMAVWLAHAVPADVERGSATGGVRGGTPDSTSGVATAAASSRAPPACGDAWSARLRQTLVAPGPWLVALCFAMYSGQWLAVIGFLPTLYTQAGVSPTAVGALTALAAAVNAIGNLSAGRLMHRGVPPPRLLATGFAVMALAAAAAFGGNDGNSDGGLPPAWRYAAVLLFSGVGGLVPATLFALAVRLAPGERTVSTTVGWMQQWSSFGQFAGPPAVAWLASVAGGWQFTWLATGACSAAGLLLTALLARRLRLHRGR